MGQDHLRSAPSCEQLKYSQTCRAWAVCHQMVSENVQTLFPHHRQFPKRCHVQAVDRANSPLSSFLTTQPGLLRHNGTSMKFRKGIVCLQVPELSPAHRSLGTEGLLMGKKSANHSHSQISSGVSPSTLSRSTIKSQKEQITQWDAIFPLPLTFLILGGNNLATQGEGNDHYRHLPISLLSPYQKTWQLSPTRVL